MSWAGDTLKYHLRFFSSFIFSFKNISSKMERVDWTWKNRTKGGIVGGRVQSFRWCRWYWKAFLRVISRAWTCQPCLWNEISHIQSLILIIKFSLAFEKVYIYTGRKATKVSVIFLEPHTFTSVITLFLTIIPVQRLEMAISGSCSNLI